MARVVVEVLEVRGTCALNYEPGDRFVFRDFYLEESSKPLCLHALASMITVLTLMLKNYSGKMLGLSKDDDVAYLQCPDPGEPLSDGGTVLFKLYRSLCD